MYLIILNLATAALVQLYTHRATRIDKEIMLDLENWSICSIIRQIIIPGRINDKKFCTQR